MPKTVGAIDIIQVRASLGQVPTRPGVNPKLPRVRAALTSEEHSLREFQHTILPPLQLPRRLRLFW